MNNLAVFSWIPVAREASKLWIPALVSLVFAAFGRLVRGVTTRGAVAGAVVCFALLVGAGARGFLALLTVFLLTWVSTRLGYARKQSLGTAERRTGRNAAQVGANLGVASICALLYATAWRDPRLLIALGAALAEAAADTVSSEIGQAVGGTPRLITTWKPVPAGTDGAITFAGTAAGVTAAIAVSLTALAPTANFPAAGAEWHTVLLCIFTAVGGMTADSLLGATLERRGILGNNSVNFTSTAIAAVLAFLAALLV
jgi:uncharacterized protein (TIGR00297 family)